MSTLQTLAEREIVHLHSQVSSAICLTEFHTVARPGAVSVKFGGVQLGAVDVFKYEGRGVSSGSRSFRHIQSNPVDEFLIFLPLRCSILLSQSNNQYEVRPGYFGILSSRKPYEVQCGEPPDYAYSELFIKVPGPMLRRHVPLLDKSGIGPISTQTDVGRWIYTIAETGLSAQRALSEEQTRIFGSMLVDAIGLATLGASDLKMFSDSLCLDPRTRLRAQAMEFIESNLSNPMLDAQLVADHCRVSIRQLHESFSSFTSTVGALIRHKRLHNCRRELMNPVMRNESIIQIAMRWGYGSSASFTRAYRALYGHSPSEDRWKSV